MKPHTFGCLRMQAAVRKEEPGSFNAYLNNEGYTRDDKIKIKAAFESLRTSQKVHDEEIL